MGADNYSWHIRGRGEEEELARLRADLVKAKALLTKAHGVMVFDGDSKKIAEEIAAFLWPTPLARDANEGSNGQ
jgi:hypothetical protein